LYAGFGKFDAAREAIAALRSQFAPDVTEAHGRRGGVPAVRVMSVTLDAQCALWSGDPARALELAREGVALPRGATALCADEGIGIPLLLCGAAAAADLGVVSATSDFIGTLD